MPDDTSTSEILAQFQPFAKSHLEAAAGAWVKSHRQRLMVFQEALKSCQLELSSLKDASGDLLSIWRILGNLTERLEEWAKESAYVLPKQKLADITNDVATKVNGIVSEFPLTIKIDIHEIYWQDQSEDAPGIRMWKAGNRLRNRGRLFAQSGMQFFRKLFNQKPLPPLKYYRQLSVRHLFTAYLLHPFEAHLSSEWQSYLYLANRHLESLHHTYQDICIRFLLPDEKENDWLSPQSIQLEASINALSTHIAHLDQCLSETDAWRVTDLLTRFDDWFAQLSRRFEERWQFAGTAMLPARQFNENRVRKNQRALEKKFKIDKVKWETAFSGEQHEWQHQLSIRRVQLAAGGACLQAALSLSDKLEAQIVPPFAEARNIFSQALTQFAELTEADSSSLKTAILTESRTILNKIRKELLPAMMTPLLRSPQDGIIKRFLHEIDSVVRLLPNKQFIFEKKDVYTVPPESKLVEIPIKELLEKEFWQQLRTKITAYQEAISKEVKDTLRSISEVDEIVEFNLEAALKSAKETDDHLTDARQVMIDGLDRAKTKMDSFIRQFQESQQLLNERLAELTREFILELNDLVQNKDLIELNFKLTRAKARERFKKYRKVVWTFIVTAIPIIWRFLKKGGALAVEYYYKLRKVTGLAPDIEGAEASLYHFLHKSQERIDTLPYIYQELFKLEPLTDKRFFAGRQQNMKNIQADFEDWKNGKFVTTAIVGEAGSGRTTVMNFAEKDVFKHISVIRIDLKNTIRSPAVFLPLLAEAFEFEDIDSIEATEKELVAMERPIVCLVENLQNMFLKTVNGFDLIEEFMALVMRTHRKVYWVFSCTLYSWEFLDKVIHISRYFQRVVNLGGITATDMENIIMKRHRLTGYELEYEAPRAVEESRKFKKLNTETEKQKYLHDMFFDRLQKLAMGNISVAMLFWMRAIRRFDSNKMFIYPNIRLDLSFINQLPEDELFTLGVIIQHELIVPEEHRRIFRLSFQESDTLMQRLFNKSILQETEGGYKVHPFLFRPVVQTLKMKNILH